ncbi:Hypothetical predicted protein [Olea europaea subsp. europaea]|uniref:Uncharacterized protein n=1 Tax=Olea europaea subsp. europaea TaxID=158383 RepID=A0A8S0S9V6_OLEEU|nr:Hypothetical predicted protein [Olea europaea subsp. europaea]
MLNSTFDLISLAASNAHVVFCLCNLIIVILLAGSSKSRSEFNEDKPFTSRGDVSNKRDYMERTNALCSSKTASSSVGTSTVDNDEGTRDEEDDELRKRAEEFIGKINKGWMDEKLKAYSL